jgi:hypothetical protein
MTRINSAIPVKNLTDEHLLAEHREIKRLPYQWCKSFHNGYLSFAPEKFTLGKGHVLFFLDKQSFILKRYIALYDECINRGFNVQNYSENWDYVKPEYLNDYEPTEEERKLLVERITDRIVNGKKLHYHYYGRQVSKEEAVGILESF